MCQDYRILGCAEVKGKAKSGIKGAVSIILYNFQPPYLTKLNVKRLNVGALAHLRNNREICLATFGVRAGEVFFLVPHELNFKKLSTLTLFIS